MMCICCDQKIPLLEVLSSDKNKTEEDIVFNKVKRQIHGKHDEEITLDAGSEIWNGGLVHLVSAGYGSTHDGDEFIIAICDDCLTKKKMTGHIAYINNYMGYSVIGDEDYEKSRIAWRRYNRIDNLLND
jgi:hypothetical protein